jgi:ubiquinone/menaquinone biosynthesis C-methylase UbiE
VKREPSPKVEQVFDASQFDPTNRFSGLADIYARFRPGYPDEALEHIVARCHLASGNLVVDAGCGTGISTRLFASRGIRMIGIEPNAEMRASAMREPDYPGMPAPLYLDGRAEATGLEDHSVDAVLAAQAFHWFNPEKALREFHRILRENGWTALLWNERDDSDAFTAAYSAVIRNTPDAAAIEVPRAKAGEALFSSRCFEQAELAIFRNEQQLDAEALLGRAFSASYAPREPGAAQAFVNALREVFDQFQQRDKVVLRYVTSVYLARRGSKHSSML